MQIERERFRALRETRAVSALRRSMRRAEFPAPDSWPSAPPHGALFAFGLRACADDAPGSRPSGHDKDDSALEQEGLGEEDPFSDVLGTAHEEDVVDMDDAVAADLDIGILLGDVEDTPHDPDAHELVLDIGELLNGADGQSTAEAGDEQGPVVPEAYYGVQNAPEDADASAVDGLVEPAMDLFEPGLPAMDGDAGDATEGLLDSEPVGELERDEPLPDWTANRWDARAAEPSLAPSSALVVAGEWVVAGGSEIWWLDHGCTVQHRVGGPGGSIVALAATAEAESAAVVLATSAGELSRAAPDRSSSDGIEGWRRAAGVRAHDSVSLELCSSAAHLSAVLLRTSSGRLLRSVNGGLAWCALELHGRVLAISSTACPAVALLECRGRRRLMRSDDGGTNWRVLEPDQTVESIMAQDGVLLSAAEHVIAVAGAASGVAICTDGVRFHRIPGCSGATALTAASVNGRDCVAVALYRELEQCSYVVAVDASGRHAVRIAEVRAASGPDDDPDSMLDYARVSALAWDATGRLWAAGGFGVMSWALCAAAVATS